MIEAPENTTMDTPRGRVVVRAPATIANLGPGFDCIGMAIAWHNEMRVERSSPGGLTVTVTGEGAEHLPRDASNLVVRAIAHVLGGDAARLRVHLMNAIPFGRGLGSSAAAIVGGLVAGRALAGDDGISDGATLVATGARIEGHADNVAPCVLGGVVIAAGETLLPLGVPVGIAAVVCVAPNALPTQVAREALPASLSLDDAAATAGRAALLGAALASGNPKPLMEATADVLHQPARFALMPDSGRLVYALRREGIAAFLAGAGPSVAALVPAATVTAVAAEAGRLAPDGWEIREAAIDATGAAVVESA